MEEALQISLELNKRIEEGLVETSIKLNLAQTAKILTMLNLIN